MSATVVSPFRPVNVDPAGLAGLDPARVSDAVEAAAEALLDLQEPDGYWCAELEGDSILQSEYILLKWIVEQEGDPRLFKIANYLRGQQREEDGAWVQYPGAKPDLSATVKAYFALKLMGDAPGAPHMMKARELILKLGGAERCNTYSKFYLAALGQMHYDSVPAVPPELVFLPRWFYFHLDKVSAWSRTMIMPLTIITHYRPVRNLPEPKSIMELYTNHDYLHRPFVELDKNLVSWKNLFLGLDKILKVYQRIKFKPLRRPALKRIEKWILRRSRPTRADGLGAIFPPMVYIIIAFRCLGYADDDPRVQEAWRQLDRLMIDEGEGAIRLQPCFSPVWDSGIALYALTEAELKAADEPRVKKAVDWLVSKECRQPGDWKSNVKGDVAPSGWYFEFNNAHYPDVDDTAMVTMALHLAANGSAPEALEAADRGAKWLLAMQNDDGGWAAFDRTVHRPLFEHVPFADHNAIQDPSCPDITGRTLECLGHLGHRVNHAAVRKAVDFLKDTQEPEGCWFGRWGVNYIYGTWQALCGLPKIGVSMTEPWVRRAGHWLKSVQKEDGSFGESADSYEDPTLKGHGPATPSQTAWGTMGLMSIYGPNDPDVVRGINWLLDTQQPGGSWEEKWFTGTGFPRVFYLRYHLYKLYFPLMCLGRWRAASRDSS